MLPTDLSGDMGNDTAKTPEQLAAHMASLAHGIRALIIATFEDGTVSSALQYLYEMFKQELLPDLAVDDFADMYTQTIAFGLFAARHNRIASLGQRGAEELRRASLRSTGALGTANRFLQDLPVTNPLLRNLFATITEPQIENEPFDYLIDELIDLLEGTSIDTLLGTPNQHSIGTLGEAWGARFNPLTHFQQDPLIHFYETFLAQYNPGLRGQRGVYYTPHPIVSYIVRSVDNLLRSHFNCRDGLAGSAPPWAPSHGTREGHSDAASPMQDEPRILLLDPACGTGAFLSTVIDHIRETYRQAGNPGAWSKYVRDCLLPGITGYELLMAPYAIAHLKLSRQLAALDLPEAERDAWAYRFGDDEFLHIYLANALEEAVYERCETSHPTPGRCKHPLPTSTTTPAPTMVVLGNPPFAGHSTNKGTWIVSLLDAYKQGCPELKKPAQAKWLSDDYVKFIRLAQWHVEQTGRGIVAFVTNHSYLDNPTFRGMRHSLLQTFDDIYILDLHGNSKKKEHAPDGSRDENAFDIQQGIAIGIFVKWRDARPGSAAIVHHAELWGLREVYKPDAQGQSVLVDGKYCWLAKNDVTSTCWSKLDSRKPFYLFASQDTQYLTEYEAGWSIPAIFHLPGDPAPGIITCHDDFAISWSRDEAKQKVERLLATETEAQARQLFRLCSQDQWQYSCAKKELAQSNWHQDLVEILYRPFDKRWTVFNRHVTVHRRERVMRHMLAAENIGLTIGRAGQVINQDQWDIVFCTRHITEFNLFRRGGNNLFPLYLYSPAGECTVNLAPQFTSALAARLTMTWLPGGRGDLQQTFGPEDVFGYIYAILHSPTYRQRYAQFLKRDFPRVPLTSNANLFRSLCNLGNKLVSLHLMEQRLSPFATYPVAGSNIVEVVRYDRDRPGASDAKGRIWINATQYFAHVPSEVWACSIGGYQISQKWLKDRRGCQLSNDELTHYLHIIAALTETTYVMREIDEVIEEQGGFPLSADSTTPPI